MQYTWTCWVAASVCSWTYDNSSWARGARLWLCILTIVTKVFEALIAYKHGDYRQCLQLSTLNVHALWNTKPAHVHIIWTLPEFVQLLDDGIVSAIALTLIVNPECRHYSRCASITQLTLSLYLMTQCQSKLRHSLTSLAQTLDYIEVAKRKHGHRLLRNRLIGLLTLAERKLVTCITTGKRTFCLQTML